MMKKNLDTEENRKFWEFVEKTAKEVESWPDWMKFPISPTYRVKNTKKTSPSQETAK